MGIDHSDRPLSERDLHADPIEQLRRWYDEAREAGLLFPEAMALATADAEGRPSVRHVLMRGLDERGIVFFTNYESRKGAELAKNPNAAAVFLWRELDRQVSVRGATERTSVEESEAYFRTRPREARIGAWASQQSRPVPSRNQLDERYRQMDDRFGGDDVPLPSYWGGFRLRPVSFSCGRSLTRISPTTTTTRIPRPEYVANEGRGEPHRLTLAGTPSRSAENVL